MIDPPVVRGMRGPGDAGGGEGEEKEDGLNTRKGMRREGGE